MIETQIIINIIVAMVAAIVYGLVFYSKNVDTEEELDLGKLGATIIVAAVVGLFASLEGVIVTYDNVILMLASYAGVVALIETLLKTIYRKVISKM